VDCTRQIRDANTTLRAPDERILEKASLSHPRQSARGCRRCRGVSRTRVTMRNAD
jgi:hypothetical protein